MPNETTWTLPTADGKTIYGLKNTAETPAKAAVFIAHGLGCSMYDYNHKRASEVFSALGYDVYRFNFYDGREGGRAAVECTLQTHADDLNQVIAAFGSAYPQTFAVGHSYGGATVMLANPVNLTAASLWDSSYDLKQAQDDFASKYIKLPPEVGGYRMDWGTSSIIGQAMYDHARTLDEKACIQLSRNFNAPVQVVFAGNGYYIKQPHNYQSHGKPENLPKNRSDVVNGTSHCFYEGDTCEELLAKTHAFFQSFR